MATGWTRDGAVQEQIDATVADAVRRARKALGEGPGLSHCQQCESTIPPARRAAIPRVRLCVTCQEQQDRRVSTGRQPR